MIFGYHGCDKAVADRLIRCETELHESTNAWDWLADGAYFWEHDPQRAYDFACEVKDHPHDPEKQKIEVPAVVGAMILPGRCLNLLDGRTHPLLRTAHEGLAYAFEENGQTLPRNAGGNDQVRRYLDCGVIRMLHEQHDQAPGGPLPFQTVRAAFFEGAQVYTGAHFAEKSHIQIAVRDRSCLVGFFKPRSPRGGPARFTRSPPAAHAPA